MTRMLAAMLVAAALDVPSLSADPIPLMERITSTTSPSHETAVRGSAGAVPPSALVAVVNLNTGHYSITAADASGAFETSLFAAGGSALLIKVDADGSQLKDIREGRRILTGELLTLGGTVMHIPDAFASTTSATASALSFFETLPPWVAQLKMDKAAYAPGEPITIEGTYALLGTIAASQTPELEVDLLMIGINRSDGRTTLDHNTYCSTVMTPTGLPIERGTSIGSSYFTGEGIMVPLQQTGNQLQATFRFTTAPIVLPDGYYRPQVMLVARGVNLTPAGGTPGVTTRIDSAPRRKDNYPYGLLPVVRIGSPAPPRLVWTLFANTLSQGVRGVTAVEDRGSFAVANRIVTSSERFIIPRVDARTRAPIIYDLEPFALTIAVGDSGEAINWPTLPIRFPSGSLTAAIKRPSGATSVIGPAAFRQSRVYWTLPRPLHRPFDANHLADPYQLTTLDERFHVAFTEDGTHEITLTGSVEDVWGHVYAARGTFIVDVGRTLEIDTALLPGTSLEEGDTINTDVQLLPGIEGDVEIRFRFAPRSRRDALVERTLRAKTGINGYAAFEPISVTQPGEYRMDVFASGRDERGDLWTGTRTWGGVVGQRSPPIQLHGLRGVDDQPSGKQAWFSRQQIGLSQDTGGHVNLAFHSGDVMWLADNGDAATLHMGIDDRLELVPRDLLQRDCGPIDDKIVIGEAPFKSSGPDRVDPHIASSADNEIWAYAYRFVERPRVRVREVIAEECVQDLYWRFDDRYGKQSGTGTNGDLPNDFKFQFGGIAMYGRVLAQPVHAIYGSLFVVIAAGDSQGTRVFPPFQGNGGLPSGGPLLRLKGREIDMFFHPTAIRPGTILDLGTTASFAGQVGPTLPSRVEFIVTSPSGVTRTITGRANTVGYFHQPQSNFIVDEPGAWRVRNRVWHDGVISTGAQVVEPFPTGGILGSENGEYSFYVVESSQPRLRLAPIPSFVEPALRPVAFAVIPPEGLTDLELLHTTTMPGFILDQDPVSGLTYTYDAKKLAADFPNLDLQDADGLTGVDTITISFLLSGKNAAGIRKYFARQVVLQGEEVLLPDVATRRRAARH